MRLLVSESHAVFADDGEDVEEMGEAEDASAANPSDTAELAITRLKTKPKIGRIR